MPELKNWQEALVVQKDSMFGAIPAGYEWMGRFNKIEGVNFDTFQDDFNLKAKGEGENNFDAIAQAVENKYPQMKIKRKSFVEGLEKVDFIRKLIEKNIPCMVSLSLSRKQVVIHEMPVFLCDDIYLRLVWRVEEGKKPDILRIEHDDTIHRHNNWGGGKDIAWLG